MRNHPMVSASITMSAVIRNLIDQPTTSLLNRSRTQPDRVSPRRSRCRSYRRSTLPSALRTSTPVRILPSTYRFRRTSQCFSRKTRCCFFRISFYRLSRKFSVRTQESFIYSGVICLVPGPFSLPASNTLTQLCWDCSSGPVPSLPSSGLPPLVP